MNRKFVFGVMLFGAVALLGMGLFVQWRSFTADRDTVEIFIPMRDIGMYEIITEKDIKAVRVAKQVGTSEFALTKEDLIGKAARNNLYAHTPVPKRALGDPEAMQDVVFITINTSFTRSGGAKVGDRVDVDCIRSSVVNNVTGLTRTELVKNARVVAVTDQNGSPAYGDGVQYMGKTPVQAVKLAIKPSERTPELEYGAVSQENGLVLTVKYDDRAPDNIKPVEIDPQEAPAENGTAGQGDGTGSEEQLAPGTIQ